MKISLKEPLWFGKRGDVPFDYEHSEWHKRYAHWAGSGSGTTLEGSGRGQREKYSSGHASGSGGGSGGTRGRNNTPDSNQVMGKALSSPEEATPSSSGTNSGLSEKRLAEQYRAHLNEQRQRNRDYRNSTGTGSTAVSRYSERPPLPEEPLDSYKSERSAHSAHSDPNWSASDMAPPPLRVPSRDSTRSNRTGRSFSQTSNSMPYSGRILGYPRTLSEDGNHASSSTGITHTESGRPTYLPDGISGGPITYLPDDVEHEIRAVLGRSGVALEEGDRVVLSGEGRAVIAPGPGSRTSSFSHHIARGAGRGH